jgi:glutathione S-transferase
MKFDKYDTNLSNLFKILAEHEVELLVNPFSSGPIHGEDNVARFFSRLLPNIFPLNYDTLDWETLVHVDGFLREASDPRVFTLELVEKHLSLLSKKAFLLGEATIADFVIFSSVATLLHQKLGLGKTHEQILSKLPCLGNWMKNCQAFGGFELFPLSS